MNAFLLFDSDFGNACIGCQKKSSYRIVLGMTFLNCTERQIQRRNVLKKRDSSSLKNTHSIREPIEYWLELVAVKLDRNRKKHGVRPRGRTPHLPLALEVRTKLVFF